MRGKEQNLTANSGYRDADTISALLVLSRRELLRVWQRRCYLIYYSQVKVP